MMRKERQSELGSTTRSVGVGYRLKSVKSDIQNPFLYTPGTPRTPNHPVLDPAMASLEQVSEHIQRQGQCVWHIRQEPSRLTAHTERLLRAADQMKQGFRKTIASLQEKNKELEAKIKTLEAEKGRK